MQYARPVPIREALLKDQVLIDVADIYNGLIVLHE